MEKDNCPLSTEALTALANGLRKWKAQKAAREAAERKEQETAARLELVFGKPVETQGVRFEMAEVG